MHQGLHGFPNGVAAGAGQLGQLGFGGDAVADTPGAADDLITQLLNDLIYQTCAPGGPQQRNASGIQFSHGIILLL
jgi:hypothetical protein